MHAAGRYDLHHAIVGQGGYLEVGSMLSRRMSRRSREPIIASVEELVDELKSFAKELALSSEAGTTKPSSEAGVTYSQQSLASNGTPTAHVTSLKLPTEKQLLEAGRCDMLSVSNI